MKLNRHLREQHAPAVSLPHADAMLPRYDLVRNHCYKRRKNRELDFDFRKFFRADRLKARIFQRGRMRAVGNDANEGFTRNELADAPSQAATDAECDERATGTIEAFGIGEFVERFTFVNAEFEGAACNFQEYFLVARSDG